MMKSFDRLMQSQNIVYIQLNTIYLQQTITTEKLPTNTLMGYDGVLSKVLIIIRLLVYIYIYIFIEHTR